MIRGSFSRAGQALAAGISCLHDKISLSACWQSVKIFTTSCCAVWWRKTICNAWHIPKSSQGAFRGPLISVVLSWTVPLDGPSFKVMAAEASRPGDSGCHDASVHIMRLLPDSAESYISSAYAKLSSADLVIILRPLETLEDSSISRRCWLSVKNGSGRSYILLLQAETHV